MRPWEEAIAKLKVLLKKNNTPDCWADNLMRASAGLTEPRDWTLFYSWITNPREFDPDKEIETLAQLETIPQPEPYEEGMEVVYYSNGPLETKIHVRNMRFYDDEKTEK